MPLYCFTAVLLLLRATGVQFICKGTCGKLHSGLKGAYSLLYAQCSVIRECSSYTCPSGTAGTLALALLLMPSDTVP